MNELGSPAPQGIPEKENAPGANRGAKIQAAEALNSYKDTAGISRSLAQIDPRTVRRYLAARRWRESHIATRTTYADPTFAAVLRNIGSWQPTRRVK